MAIKVGDRLPAVTLRRFTASGIEEMSTEDLTRGRKVVIFAVPGAFTPTCSERHLPTFLDSFDALKAKGVDRIVCVAVNDPFVLAAWEKDRGVDGRIEMLSDGNAEFTKALGLEFDGTSRGLGIRSQRYAMVVEDGVVKALMVEDAPGQAEKSGAQAVLAAL